MKKLFYTLSLFLALLLLFANPVLAAKTVYLRTGKIGGAATDLDIIPWADCDDEEIAFVFESEILYVYEYESTSSAGEVDPTIIKPDDAGAEDGRWLLQQLELVVDTVDAITEIAAALKSGDDVKLVTGTAGTDTYTAVWNADGDLVDGPGVPYVVGGTDVAIGDGGTGEGTASAAFGALKQAATDAATGVVELATGAETATGTDTGRAVTPDGLADLIQYKTIEILPTNMWAATTAGAPATQSEYGTNDLDYKYFVFDGAAVEWVHFYLPVPEGWDLSTFKAKFQWASAAGSTGGDTVEWGLGCQAISDSDPLDVALGDAGEVISDALHENNGTDLQITDATPAITVGGSPALGDLIFCKGQRNPDGADNMEEDAWLFKIIVQMKLTEVVAAW